MCRCVASMRPNTRLLSHACRPLTCHCLCPCPCLMLQKLQLQFSTLDDDRKRLEEELADGEGHAMNHGAAARLGRTRFTPACQPPFLAVTCAALAKLAVASAAADGKDTEIAGMKQEIQDKVR
jgi:hypothetical protein